MHSPSDTCGIDTTTNLGVEIVGRVPATLRQTGDAEFEHSRITAQVKLDGLIFQARSQKSAEKHLEELYELKAGSAIEQVPLADIEQCWLNLPSRKRRTELWEKNQCATLRKFREFIEKHHAQVFYLAQVTPRIAQEWLRYLDELGYAAAIGLCASLRLSGTLWRVFYAWQPQNSRFKVWSSFCESVYLPDGSRAKPALSNSSTMVEATALASLGSHSELVKSLSSLVFPVN